MLVLDRNANMLRQLVVPQGVEGRVVAFGRHHGRGDCERVEYRNTDTLQSEFETRVGVTVSLLFGHGPRGQD